MDWNQPKALAAPPDPQPEISGVQDGRWCGVLTEVGEETHHQGESDRPVWDTSSTGSQEQLWSMPTHCQTDQSSRGNVHKRVSGRPSGSEDNGIDNRRECLDLSIDNGNDPWRTGRVGSPGQSLGGVWNEHTDNERGTNVEQANSVDDSFGSFGDLSSRVGGFRSGKHDDFGTRVRVSCVDKGSEEGQESTERSGDIVVLDKRSRVFPVSETDSVVGWCSSEIDHETQDEQADMSIQIKQQAPLDLPDNGDNLDRTGEDLCLSVKVDGHVVEHDDGDEADGDPDSSVQVGPIGNDDGRSGELCRD